MIPAVEGRKSKNTKTGDRTTSKQISVFSFFFLSELHSIFELDELRFTWAGWTCVDHVCTYFNANFAYGSDQLS